MNEIKKIFIIAGHGAGDPGAVTEEYSERQMIEYICGEIYEATKDSGLFEVVNLKPEIGYAATTAHINTICRKNGWDWRDALLVSVHCDWKGASSGEMAYYYRGSPDSQRFAETVIKHMPLKDKYTKPDTSCRFGRIGHVVDTDPLACLVECGSLGADILHLRDNYKDIAHGIIDGCLSFCGKKNDTEESMEFLMSQNWHNAEALKSITDDKVMLARINKIQENVHKIKEFLKSKATA